MYAAMFVYTSEGLRYLTLKSRNTTYSNLIGLLNVCVRECFKDKLEYSLMEGRVRELLDFSSHMLDMICLQNVASTKMGNIHMKLQSKYWKILHHAHIRYLA